MGHSQFERIPISRERQERLLYEQIDEITEGIAEVQASGGERFTVKQLERTRKSLEARLEKLQAEGRKDDVVTFEQLGVDRLFCLLYTSDVPLRTGAGTLLRPRRFHGDL